MNNRTESSLARQRDVVTPSGRGGRDLAEQGKNRSENESADTHAGNPVAQPLPHARALTVLVCKTGWMVLVPENLFQEYVQLSLGAEQRASEWNADQRAEHENDLKVGRIVGCDRSYHDQREVYKKKVETRAQQILNEATLVTQPPRRVFGTLDHRTIPHDCLLPLVVHSNMRLTTGQTSLRFSVPRTQGKDLERVVSALEVWCRDD